MSSGSMTKSLEETLDLFDEAGEPRGTNEVAEMLDLGRRSTYDRLDRLVERGHLDSKKIGPSARVWWRPRTDVSRSDADSTSSPKNGESKHEPSDVESRVTDGTEIPVQAVLDDADVGVFVLDSDFHVAWINDATERYFGLDREDVIGRDKRELLREQIQHTIADSDTFAETVLATYDDNEGTEAFECHVTPGEGREVRWLEHRSRPIESGPYAGGRVELYHDITDLERTKRQLERQRDDLESELDDVFERIDDAFYGLDDQFRFIYVNERAEEFLGRTEEELLGERLWDAFPTTRKTATWDHFHTALESQESISYETDSETFDRWVEVNVYPSETGLSVYFRDISDRKERERELERYRTIVESFPDGVFALDDEERFVMVNEAFVEMSGYERDEIVGSHGSLIRDGSIEELTTGYFGDDGVILEFDFQTADGDSIPVEARFSHYKYEGYTDARTGVTRDISEREQYEETLTALYDSAQELLGAQTKEEVGEVIVETVTQVLDISGVAVYCYEERKDLLVPVAQSSGPEFIREDLKPWIPGDSSVHGHVFANGETIRYDDVTDSPYLQNDETSMRAGVFVPLGDYGVFSVGSERVDAFDRQIQQLLELLGANAEVALDRVERERALEESERRYRTLIEHFPNGAVALIDRDLRYLAIGGELFIDVDGPVSVLEGRTVCDHLPDDVLETVEVEYRATFEGQRREFEVNFGDRIAQFRTVPLTGDGGKVSTIIAMSQEVTERRERERELERQREQLTAINNLNAIVHDITEAIINQSTREEIEEIVCERLATSDSYMFAWIGDVDMHSETVNLRTEAGVEGYLDGVTISIDPDDERSKGPTGQAILQREIQVANDIHADSSHDPWRDYVEQYGFRSSAAIPIMYDETLYGVLNVYAERSNAFTDNERAVISQLGEIIGHAIAAVERKRALMSDEVVELEFQISDVFGTFDIPGDLEGSIDLDQAVPIGDGNFLEYGRTTGNGMDVVEALVASGTLPHWESVTVIDTDDEGTRFELRLTDPPVLSMVSSHGGYVQRARFEGDDYTMRIHLPPGADVRQVVDAVKTAYPAIRMITQRQVTRDSQSSSRFRSVLFEELTDRQRAAIEAAYYAGFFEWPRDTTGEMVAKSMDVSASTFHQHLRKGQLKLFATLFEAETTDEART